MPCKRRARPYEEIGATGESRALPNAEPVDMYSATPSAVATAQCPATAAAAAVQQHQRDNAFHDEQWSPNPMAYTDPMFRSFGRLGNGVPAPAAQMSLDPAQSPQLSVSSDGQEGHFLLAYRLCEAQYHFNSIFFGIVALRFVKFSDQELLVSCWCKNCPCGTSSSTDDRDRDMSKVSSSSFFNQHPPTLRAGAAAFVDSLGKDTLRAAFLHRATLLGQQQQQLPCVVAVPVGVFRNAYSAVRTAAPFSSWGVVKHEHSGQLLCMSCPSLRRQCAHVSALPPPAVVIDGDNTRLVPLLEPG